MRGELNAATIERPLHGARLPWIALGLGVSLAIVAALVLGGVWNERLALSVLGAFTALGIAGLLAWLFGIVRVTTRRTAEEIGLALLDGGDSALLVADERGGVVFSNARYATLLGTESGAAIVPPSELFARDSAAAVAFADLELETASTGAASTELRVSTGTQMRWFRVEAQRIAVVQGEWHTAWRIIDVSSERAAQEVGFAAARTAIEYLDRLPVGFVATRADGVVTHLNATIADWLGFDLTAFREREVNVRDLLSRDATSTIPTDGIHVSEAQLRVAGDQDVPAIVLDVMGDDATHHTLSIVIDGRTIAPVQGEVVSMGAGRFDRFYEATPVALAAIDTDQQIQQPNAAFRSMFAAEGTLAGRDLLSIVPESERKRIADALATVRSGNRQSEPIDMVLRTDVPGKERYLRFTLTPSADDDDVALIQATESTEQKAIENAYIQGQKMQAVGLLAGGIAHDFNNVLAAISLSSDLLLETHGVTDPSHGELRNIKLAANKGASLIKQLLAFSRRQTMRFEELQLADALSDARMLYTRVATPAELSMEFGPDLWPVWVDEGQLGQVVTNLVANARDAMPDGGSIRISARNLPMAEAEGIDEPGFEPADYVLLEVADNGTGMPDEVRQQIFVPFYTTKGVGEGTGLGMATVYGIVKQSEGYIYCDSEVGVGTRFRILLPRRRPNAAVEARPVEKVLETKRDLTGTGTVLVVEDDNSVRPGAVRALASRGYTVHEAMDGEEALEVLEELGGEVDIIVSDVVMPGMDGPTFLTEMRKLYGEAIPFIFASGHAEDAFAQNLPEGSKFSFLPKPYSLKDLAAKVKDELANRA